MKRSKLEYNQNISGTNCAWYGIKTDRTGKVLNPVSEVIEKLEGHFVYDHATYKNAIYLSNYYFPWKYHSAIKKALWLTIKTEFNYRGLGFISTVLEKI